MSATGKTPMPKSPPGITIDWELRLGFLIHDVSRLRRSAFDRSVKVLNVTRSQWWVLAYLSRDDGMTQSQLAEELDLGKVAVGGLLDRLERTGLVRRAPDASDRRVNRVFLESKGKALVARLRKISQEHNDEILAGLSEEALETTATTLAAIKHSLIKKLQSTEP